MANMTENKYDIIHHSPFDLSDVYTLKPALCSVIIAPSYLNTVVNMIIMLK